MSETYSVADILQSFYAGEISDTEAENRMYDLYGRDISL